MIPVGTRDVINSRYANPLFRKVRAEVLTYAPESGYYLVKPEKYPGWGNLLMLRHELEILN